MAKDFKKGEKVINQFGDRGIIDSVSIVPAQRSWPPAGYGLLCQLQNAIRRTQYAIRVLFQQLRQRHNLQGLRGKLPGQNSTIATGGELPEQFETNRRSAAKNTQLNREDFNRPLHRAARPQTQNGKTYPEILSLYLLMVIYWPQRFRRMRPC